MSITGHRMTGGDTGIKERLQMLAPSLAALLYPFALEGFNASVTRILDGSAGALGLSWLGAAMCGFAPLRAVPKNKGVVLGLISSKVSDLEDLDMLKRRVGEATRYIDPARLAVSPQCGFASAAVGRPTNAPSFA
jgi:methionine synthase II (cobalamin-independent)